MYLHFHLSRIVKDIEKIRLQTPKKRGIQKKWFSNLTNKDLDDFSNYLNLFF